MRCEAFIINTNQLKTNHDIIFKTETGTNTNTNTKTNMEPPERKRVKIIRKKPIQIPIISAEESEVTPQDHQDQILILKPKKTIDPLYTIPDSTSGNTNTKTKKKKTIMSADEKRKLWAVFETDKREIEIGIGSESVSDELSQRYATKSICRHCDTVLIIMEDGFPTCVNPQCGTMYRDILDFSPEWRFFGGDDKNGADPTRCGNPVNPLLQESSLGCKIICSPNSSYEMKRIRKWTEWQAMPHKEKTLYDEFLFITVMAQNSGISRIFIDKAMEIYKDISEQKMFRGMNRDGIKSASIYISCRLNGCPRTAHEIADIFKLDKTSATYGCSMAVNILHNIERNMEPEHQTNLGMTTPSSFIERFCSRLSIVKELTMLALFIAKKIETNNSVCDNTPHSVAAGIIYFIAQTCNLNITKADIKSICNVSEVTINKCYKKLEQQRDTLIPKAILAKYT